MTKPKKPSLALRRKMQPIIDAARKAVLLAPAGNLERWVSIHIVWPVEDGVAAIPEGFTKGRLVTRTDVYERRVYGCTTLFRWLKANLYTDYDAGDLRRSRHKIVLGLTKMEKDFMKELDLEQLEAYNGSYDDEGN